MGQAQRIANKLIPDSTMDAVHMEIVRHSKVISEINALTYEEFNDCLEYLNTLSRKCIDPTGKQLLFLVKKGSDSSLLWKATVQIACIKVDSDTRQIDTYKFLNLKQFLSIFNTFQSYLGNLVASEQNNSSQLDCESAVATKDLNCDELIKFGNVDDNNGRNNLCNCSVDNQTCKHFNGSDECCICLERCTEVILPCTHSFCVPCIEQWNVNSKTCPICSETLNSTDETWVMSELPDVQEINERICNEFMALLKN